MSSANAATMPKDRSANYVQNSNSRIFRYAVEKNGKYIKAIQSPFWNEHFPYVTLSMHVADMTNNWHRYWHWHCCFKSHLPLICKSVKCCFKNALYDDGQFINQTYVRHSNYAMNLWWTNLLMWCKDRWPKVFFTKLLWKNWNKLTVYKYE